MILNYSDYSPYHTNCYNGEAESFKVGTENVNNIATVTSSNSPNPTLTLTKTDQDLAGKHTVEHKRGLIVEYHEIVVCNYAPNNPEIIKGELDHFHVKQLSSAYEIEYGEGTWVNEPECGSKMHLAVIGDGSEYDPWSTS